MLTAILGFSEIILSQLSPTVPIGKDVDEFRRAALQGAQLTEQLLAFSRRRPRALHLVSLTEITRTSRELLQQLVGERVTIRVTLDDGVWPILADAAHVQQVLVNLAVNARDAMPTGGVVTLRTGTRRLDRPAVLASTTVPAGDYVFLAVGDTGSGMSRHIVAQVFDPFFTTKAAGKGTGLGLATVYGIVQQHGGYIDVESTPSRGAVFTTYFPRADGDLPDVHDEGAEAGSPVGHERVLVVEDDRAVRGFVTSVLTRHGYTVRDAADGREALSVVEGEAAPFDLVLTDIAMPRLDGLELAARLPRRESKVLYMSGNPSWRGAVARIPAGITLLEKPFSSITLLQTVRRMLDGAVE